MDGTGLFPDSPDFFFLCIHPILSQEYPDQMVAFILMDIVLVIRAYVYSISKQIQVKTPVLPVNRCEFKTTKKHLEKKKSTMVQSPMLGKPSWAMTNTLPVLLDWFLNGNPYGKITTKTVNQDKPASLAAIHPGNGKSLPCTTLYPFFFRSGILKSSVSNSSMATASSTTCRLHGALGCPTCPCRCAWTPEDRCPHSPALDLLCFWRGPMAHRKIYGFCVTCADLVHRECWIYASGM